MTNDRNFDDLAHRFQRKVYGGIKGEIRLAVLKRDLTEFFPGAMAAARHAPLNILDAGGGTGPFSVIPATLGHRVTLCDLSRNMLVLAEERFNRAGAGHQLTLCHGPLQEMAPDKFPPFDLIFCHGVLGWVEDPAPFIARLMDLLCPGGCLSLTFYNLHAMIYKNLLRTNYKKIQKQAYNGWPGSLTPAWPRTPEQVEAWLVAHPLDILCRSGIRVFHDYVLDPVDREKAPKTVIELELSLSRQLPYRNMGRYLHYLGIKQPA